MCACVCVYFLTLRTFQIKRFMKGTIEVHESSYEFSWANYYRIRQMLMVKIFLNYFLKSSKVTIKHLLQ